MRNRIELQSFFNYVFRDEEVIHQRIKRIKGTKESKEEQETRESKGEQEAQESKGKKETRKQLLEKEIQRFFEELFVKKPEKAVTKKDDEKKDLKETEAESKKIAEEREKQQKKLTQFMTRLRPVLKTVKAIHLEEILYPEKEKKTETPLKEYTFRPDEDIISSLRILDQKYKYFSEIIEDKAFQGKFLSFYKLCKVIADTIESPDNSEDDSEVLLQAYKLLVLFGSGNNPSNYFKAMTQYLKIHNYASQALPLHDALIWKIPKRVPEEKMDLKSWQTLITNSGKKAFRLFNLANPIEKELGRAPKEMEEAISTAMKVSYSKLAEYKDNPKIVEFAELCIVSGINENDFNRCLEIYFNRLKKVDYLPEANISQEGYHLVKLPLDDFRAFILGHITDCCQSIGGESEVCVIDGITLPNNGFYVMLKSKDKKSKDSPFLPDGKIDYQKFDIVGQGYAWRSRSGNLTFDSWENLRPTNDPQAVHLLSKFAEQVMKTSPDILRVTIGKGGKTPPVFTQQSSCTPELIKEGTQFGDSYAQSLIARNEAATQEIQTELKQVIQNEIKEIEEKSLKILVNPSNIYSRKQPESLRAWLKLRDVRDRLKNFGLQPDDGTIYAYLSLMHEAGVEPQPDIAALLSKIDLGKSLLKFQAIIQLTRTGAFQHPKIRNAILADAFGAAVTRKLLKLNNLYVLMDPQLIEVAMNNESDQRILSKLTALIQLTKDNLLEDKFVYDTLIKYDKLVEARGEDSLPDIILKLKKTELLENKELSLKVIEDNHPDPLMRGLCILKSNGLLGNKKCVDLLFENTHSATSIARLLAILKKENLLDNEKVNKHVKKNLQSLSAYYIVDIYNQLEEKLETAQLIKDTIFREPESAEILYRIVSILKEQSLLNDKELCQVILAHPDKFKVKQTLYELRRDKLLVPEKRSLILIILNDPTKYVPLASIANILPNEVFQYENLVEAIEDNPSYNLAVACSVLSKANLLNDPSIQKFLIDNARREHRLISFTKMIEENQDKPIKKSRLFCIAKSEFLTGLIDKKIMTLDQVEAMSDDEFNKLSLGGNPDHLDKAHPGMLISLITLETWQELSPERIDNFNTLYQLMLHNFMTPSEFHSLLENPEVNPFRYRKDMEQKLPSYSHWHRSYNTTLSKTSRERLLALPDLQTACIENTSKLFKDIVEKKNQEQKTYRQLTNLCSELKIDFALDRCKENYCAALIKQFFEKPNGSFSASKDQIESMLKNLDAPDLIEDLLPLIKNKIVACVTDTIKNTKWATKRLRGTAAVHFSVLEKAEETDPDIARLWNRINKSKAEDKLQQGDEPHAFDEMITAAQLALLHGSILRDASIDHFFKQIVLLKELDSGLKQKLSSRSIRT